MIGTGEAFDYGIGNTAYLLRGARCPAMLFDCGYQIPERLWRLDDYARLDAICLTHLHADHSFGIVPLLTRFREERRERPLRVFGPRGTEAFVTRLLGLGYPGLPRRLGFALEWATLDPAVPVRWRGLRIRCARTTHSVVNHTIRVDLTKSAGGPASFAVSGDGQITEETRALVADAGFLFQEVYAERPGVPVHADLETIAAFVAASPALGGVGVAHHARGERKRVRAAVRRLARADARWRALVPGDRVSLAPRAR